MNIRNVAIGWINVVRDELGILPDEIKTMAEKRLVICNSCIYGGYTCGQCGCPLTAKTKSPNSKCPIAKW